MYVAIRGAEVKKCTGVYFISQAELMECANARVSILCSSMSSDVCAPRFSSGLTEAILWGVFRWVLLLPPGLLSLEGHTIADVFSS